MREKNYNNIELIERIAKGWEIEAVESLVRPSSLQICDIEELISKEGYENLVFD